MRLALLASSILATTAFAMPATAQDAGEGSSATGEDTIVVTARKREENLIDVPLPVSVATAAQLERDKVYTITDLQRVTPALEVSPTSGGENNGGARLRGLGTGVFNATVSPSVAFVVDQVPQGNLTFPLMFDLQQVEVLRGPQGTLFGQGASAGVINVSTVAPSTDRFSVNGGIDFADKGTLGSEVGELTARVGLNAPLGDTAAIRVAAYTRREKGLQRNTFLDRDNKINDLGLRARLLFEPSERLTINLSAEYIRTKMRGWNFFAIAIAPNATTLVDPDGPGPAPTLPVNVFSNGAFLDPAGCGIPAITPRAEFYCEDTQARFTNSTAGFSGRVDYELSDSLTLTSVTAYRTADRETETVNFSRRLNVAARNENIENYSKQFSEELRLTYEGEGLDVVAGALYSKFNYSTSPIVGTTFNNTALGQRTGFSVCANSGAFCPVPLDFTYEKTRNSTKALFADLTYALTEQLDAFGGLRYSNYRNSTGIGVDSLTFNRPVTRIKDNDISGRIGLSYKPSSASTIYASFARGYKPPAVFVPTIIANPVTILDPEKSSAFELGAKAEVGRLQLSGNVFYTKIRNFQSQTSVFDSAGALVSVTQNIRHVKSKGFELNAFGKLSDNISINAGYQFNDVKASDDFVGNDRDPVVSASLRGTQFLNSPKHKFTLSGDFSLPVTDSLEAFLNANLVYKSKTLLAQNGDPRFRYPGHELLNGRIGIRDSEDKWTAAIFVRNLTKEREPVGYLASDFAGTPDGGIRAWPVAGLTARVVGVSLGFDF
jgi:iron complex outermembrane recepter protein